MKHLIVITSALALLVGTISSASAYEGTAGGRGHWRGHRHNRTVIIQEQPQAFGLGVGVNLGALLLSQLLAQPQQVAEPLVFPDDPAPTKKFRRPRSLVEPKLRQDSPIPMK